MKNSIVAAAMILAIGGVTAAIIIHEPDPEVIKAKAEAMAAKAAIEEAAAREREEKLQRRHQEYLEREQAKSPEQKMIEAQNETTVDAGEAILGTAGIAAGAYIISKLLDY